MKIVKQSYKLLGTPKSLDEAWGFVAAAARNCYQSSKINPDESEEDFCKRILLKHPEDLECDHMSPFEFGIVYLSVPITTGHSGFHIWDYFYNPYSRVADSKNLSLKDEYGDRCDCRCITTNLRVILENHWEDDLKYAGPPTEHHVKACCFRLITNRAVMAEITRHRTLSFCIESTRYCNYSKDKFGNELTFITPPWEDKGSFPKDIIYLPYLEGVEKAYIKLINSGCTPQQAATILPNALKTTIMMCGYEDSLQHMFRLRAEECSGSVHPQMAEIMNPLYEEYKQWLVSIK